VKHTLTALNTEGGISPISTSPHLKRLEVNTSTAAIEFCVTPGLVKVAVVTGSPI
jgi:hypothetical protein